MNTIQSNSRITKVETTNDTITGRGGLALFSRYLEKIFILAILAEKFGDIRKSNKGLSVWLLFKQVICFLFDGTSSHISYFDDIKIDEGYAAAIETDPSEMASSHMIKRFFGAFGWWCCHSFRWILHKLFIWRLKHKNPDVIEIYMDTMVMNNDDADKREGVQPTYKKVKGFQPLHLIWERKIIDAIFRGGSKNGNCGHAAVNMVRNIVNLIRSEYREDVTIILKCDAGFFSEDNFTAFNEMNIGFIATGKMYEGVKNIAGSTPEEFWGTYYNGHEQWNYIEFGFRCDSWNFFLRAIYTHLCNDGQQMLFEFERPDNVILTNIGINKNVLKYCTPEQTEYWLKIATIIGTHHQNGADELSHRGLKDFGSEQLPFKRFGSNSAFYYCMLISFFLFETFKEDALAEVIPVTGYATTIRRKIIDIAAKIVRTGHQIILKVSKGIMETFRIDLIWQKCQTPPPIII